MSGHQNKDEARLLNVAAAMLFGNSKKLNLSKEFRLRAGKFGIERLQAELAAVSEESEAATPVIDRPQHQIDGAIAVHSRKQISAIHEVLKPESVKVFSTARKERRDQADVAYRATLAPDRFAGLWDEIKIRGKAVGDIWYSELDHYAEAGAYEASLCRQLKGHAIPNEDIRCRYMAKGEALNGMHRIAVEESRRWRTQG